MINVPDYEVRISDSIRMILENTWNYSILDILTGAKFPPRTVVLAYLGW